MKDNHILLSISMLISGKEDMEKSLKSLQYFKEAIPCEIILVDTGCNAKQRALAEQYADEIYDFAWCNDFAAARNVGLQAAKGEWFLYLDDDEWFENPKEIIEFFQSGEYRDYNCASYVVRNYSNPAGTLYEDSYPSRMVKREANTRFVGKIHEYLDPFHLPKKEFSDYVHHYGYVYKNNEDRKMHSMRNVLPLIEMRKEHPGDPRWMCQLAQEYFSVKDYEETIKVCVEGINEWYALVEYVKYAPAHVGALYAYILISLECLQRFEEEEEWLKKAFANPIMRMKIMEPTEAFYCLAAARLYSNMGKYAQCCEYFKRYLSYFHELKDDRNCIEIGTAGTVTGVFQEKPYNGVTLMCLESTIRMQDYELAKEAFYGLNWSDARLLHQHPWEKKMLDACCMVAPHPLWTEMMSTLVTREGGADEMYEVLLDLEYTYEEEGQQEKLLRMRELMEPLEGEAWQAICQPHYRKKDEEEYANNWSMDLELAYGILEILQTVWDAVKQMHTAYTAKDIETFNALSMDVWEALTAVQNLARQQVPVRSRIRLEDACTCALESLKDIKMLVLTNPEKVEWKLEYELAPIVETTAMQFYYWGIVDKHPEKREEFQEFIANTEVFGILQVPEEERQYEYDLLIHVVAYNKLEYTKKCVESILENLPHNIKYDIVFLNHGSTDGTKEYFESIGNAKTINVAVNGAVPSNTLKSIMTAKYFLAISNDVMMGANAIDNLYRCMAEHKEYGYIVPSTPAVSNLQTIPSDYHTDEQFYSFAATNNLYDESRHEQRVRLCNPLSMFASEAYAKMILEHYEDRCCNKQQMSFPDDKTSIWMRRNGYKCILAKDAYCHHFGSVTLKEDMGTQLQKQHFYKEGRKTFEEVYGIDPWGLGCCFDLELFNMWDFPIIDNAVVLGINCGLGSNSLKIKEILKEKGAQGSTLYNVTQEERYIQDLKGISDEAFVIDELSGIPVKTGRTHFHYIVVDEPMLNVDSANVAQIIVNAGITFDELAWRTSDGGFQIARWTR